MTLQSRVRKALPDSSVQYASQCTRAAATSVAGDGAPSGMERLAEFVGIARRLMVWAAHVDDIVACRVHNVV